jgi:hypothetical protein
MKRITPGSILTARSICDYDCIFAIRVVSRTERTAVFTRYGKISRTKIRRDESGEYLRPDSFSMAPIFRAA